MGSKWVDDRKNDSIDLAAYFEQFLLKYQEPMNAVIDRGDSPIQQFYRGATVFVTGGSGFLGKHLIEKLFRSCEIKKLYMLMRPKKSKSSKQRIAYMLKDPVFELVRARNPNFAEKIEPVEGDVAELKLGLSDTEWSKLSEQVDTIFHVAATVRFDSPLQEATVTNVRGTRETISLARSCKKLKNYVHMSTAYTHATKDRAGQEVQEKFYECPVPPELMIEMAETLPSEKLDKMTPGLIKGWPNTYSFTKALAEELIRKNSDLPICVVKPPIVLISHYEPSPGWLDINAISGASGIILGVVIGIIRVFYIDRNCNLPITPVDYVNNCAIAAGWDAAERRKRGQTDVPLYIVTNKDAYISWRSVGRILRSESSLKMASPKAVWYCFLIETKNKLAYNLLAFFLHYLPAYIMDAVCYLIGKKPKEIRSFVDVYRKVDKFTEIYDYFWSNEWDFKDTNVQAMISNMSDADRAIYNCNVNSYDRDELPLAWVIGARKYIIKDELKNTDKGYARQKMLRVASYGILAIFFYMIWMFITLMI